MDERTARIQGAQAEAAKAHLDALLDRARAAGLPVLLEIEGRRDSLPLRHAGCGDVALPNLMWPCAL